MKSAPVPVKSSDRVAPSRAWGIVLPVALGVAMLALLLSAVYSGAAAEREALDPGAFTRWALPVVTAVHHVVMAVVVGCLLVAALIVPPSADVPDPSRWNARRVAHPAFTRVMNTAAGAAVFWVFCAVAVMVLTYSNLIGQPVSGDANFGGRSPTS